MSHIALGNPVDPPEHPPPSKLKLAVWKFASCDGCQLSLLDLEDEFLALSDHIEIAHFAEASSRKLTPPYDLSLVEGSITTHEDEERIQQIRRDSKLVVTIGACASSGGIQALRNFADTKDFVDSVYPRPDWIDVLESTTPIAHHITVDYELRGCPVNKHQLLKVIIALVHGKTPDVPRESVCMACKRQGLECVLVSRGQACLGPVTQSGCEALCPRYGRACYGCFGPKDASNASSLAKHFQDRETGQGRPHAEVLRIFGLFHAASPEFAGALDGLGPSPSPKDSKQGNTP